MATRTANAGSNNWNTNAAWVGGVQPTAADDVVIPTGATVTVPASATVLCRSLSVTGTGVLTQTAAGTSIQVGDATAGAGNVAISFSSGSTYNTSGSNGNITLVSTSATQQTITTNGKSLTNLLLNGVGSSYVLTDDLTWNSAAQVAHNAGTFDTANYTLTGGSFSAGGTSTRTLTLGSSAINLSTNWGASNVTLLTVTANTAVVTINSSSTGNQAILIGKDWNGLSMILNSTTNSTTISVGGTGARLANLTLNCGAAQMVEYLFTDSLTITGAFTTTGDSVTNRVVVASSVLGTQRTLTANTTSISNTDFRDIAGAGSGSWAITSGYTGDRGGNSNISFTTPLPTTISTAGSTNDASKWSGGRVPLPQDDVTFSGSANITLNHTVIGANVDMSSYTGTLSLTSTATEYSIYGSVTLGSGMSWGTNPNTFYLGLFGRGTHTLTSNGKLFFPAGSNATLIQRGAGGSYTLTDNLSYRNPVSASFQNIAGSFDSMGYTMDIGRWVSNGSITRSTNFRTSQINSYNTSGSTFITATATGHTVSALDATFNVMVASSPTRSLDLGGIAIGTFNYTVAGSTGQLNVTSSGYIDNFNFSDATNARTLQITSGQTLTVNNFNVVGASGRVVTVKSGTAGNPAYIEVLGAPATTDYLSVQDIFGVIPNKLYVGSNSTDVSGNTNVEFTATPTGPYISRRGDVQVSNSSSATANFGYGLAPSAGRKIIAFYSGTNNIAGTITPPAGFTQIGTIQGTAPWITVWEGISDGVQTSLTFSKSGTAPQISGIKMYSLGGFVGTPTFDVSDYNSVSASTSLNSAGSAPSNTDNPALAIMVLAANNSMGASVSATNGFGVMRDSTELTAIRAASKALFSNAPVSTTYTWTTSRNAQSALVVYKDVASNNSAFLMFMGL